MTPPDLPADSVAQPESLPVVDSRTHEQRAILVLGMHRSGTSALTRVLSLLGATLPNRIMAGVPDNNETGFWESVEIMAIHDEILASAGCCWHDVSEFPNSWFRSDVAKLFRTRLVAALREAFSDAPVFIVKDPRMCRLVPLWLAVLEELGATPLFVIPIRNPLEVAASLRARDGFFEAKSALLWLRHFLAAEKHTRGFQRSFVTYSQLLENWRGVADRITRDLDVHWPRTSYVAELEISSFLSARLQHHHMRHEDLFIRSDIADWLKSVYHWATKVADDCSVSTTILDDIHKELGQADKTFMPIITATEMRASELCDALKQHRREVEQLESQHQREIEQHQREIEQLQSELSANLARHRGEVEEAAFAAAAAAHDHEAELQALRTALATAQGEAKGLLAANEAAERAVAAFRSELNARSRAAEDSLVAANTRAEAAAHELAAAQAWVDSVLASSSWRVTAPLRAMGRLVFRRR